MILHKQTTNQQTPTYKLINKLATKEPYIPTPSLLQKPQTKLKLLNNQKQQQLSTSAETTILLKEQTADNSKPQ